MHTTVFDPLFLSAFFDQHSVCCLLFAALLHLGCVDNTVVSNIFSLNYTVPVLYGACMYVTIEYILSYTARYTVCINSIIQWCYYTTNINIQWCTFVNSKEYYVSTKFVSLFECLLPLLYKEGDQSSWHGWAMAKQRQIFIFIFI